MVSSWIGNGSVMPSVVRARTSADFNPNWSNVVKCRSCRVVGPSGSTISDGVGKFSNKARRVDAPSRTPSPYQRKPVENAPVLRE